MDLPRRGYNSSARPIYSFQNKTGGRERHVCGNAEQDELEKGGGRCALLCAGDLQRLSGADVDGASITADKVKIPRKWDDSFSAFNGVVQQSGMDLTRYKGKTVEKWTALIPAASSGETSRYGVLLVYRKKAVGAYLLEKPSGTVIGLKDAQTAMAQAEQQDAQQVSGEDYSGDWGERHDEELGAAGQSQQTSGEPDSVVPEEAQYTDLPLDAEGYPVE